MSYEFVDSTINAWVAKHALSLFSDPGRSVYLSSDDGECCQIWIDLPDSNRVHLHAAAVEARENEEMRIDWDVPMAELSHALENAVTSVRQWFTR